MSNEHPPGWIPAPAGWRWTGYAYDHPRGTVWYDSTDQCWVASTDDGEYTTVAVDPNDGITWIEEGT